MDELQTESVNQTPIDQTVVESTPVSTTSPTSETPKKSKTPVFILAGVIILIVVIGLMVLPKPASAPQENMSSDQIDQSSLESTSTTYEPTDGSNSDSLANLKSMYSAAPTGFSWYTCENIPAGFLKPDGWFTKEESNAGTQACFITKENIDTDSVFTTGLTVNVIKNAKSKYNYSAKEYASVLMSEYEKMVSEGTLDSVGQVNTIGQSPITGYSREATKGDNHFFYLNVANEQTDTLYLISFEGKEPNWTTDFEEIGKVILSNFVVLPGV